MNRFALIAELRKLIVQLEDAEIDANDAGLTLEDIIDKLYDTADSGKEW